MLHRPRIGATTRQLDVYREMTRAEADAGQARARAAPGSGLGLIRELIEERGRRREFDDHADAPHDDVQWDPPFPDERTRSSVVPTDRPGHHPGAIGRSPSGRRPER